MDLLGSGLSESVLGLKLNGFGQVGGGYAASLVMNGAQSGDRERDASNCVTLLEVQVVSAHFGFEVLVNGFLVDGGKKRPGGRDTVQDLIKGLGGRAVTQLGFVGSWEVEIEIVGDEGSAELAAMESQRGTCTGVDGVAQVAAGAREAPDPLTRDRNLLSFESHPQGVEVAAAVERVSEDA